MNHANVQGYTGLQRDLNTSAIVSTDREALLAARARKAQILADKNRIIELETRLTTLEELITKMIGETNGKSAIVR